MTEAKNKIPQINQRRFGNRNFTGGAGMSPAGFDSESGIGTILLAGSLRSKTAGCAHFATYCGASGNILRRHHVAITPSPVPPRLMKAPAAVHPLPQKGEGLGSTLPSPLWGRGAGGEGVFE